MNLTYTPAFLRREKVFTHYRPDIAAAMREGIEFARNNKNMSAAALRAEARGILMVLTDLLEDFRDDGRLPVKGTDQVVWNLCLRLVHLATGGDLAGVMLAFDGHPPLHISFDTYWRDADGNTLDLSEKKAALLFLEDEEKCLFRAEALDGCVIGIYKAVLEPKDSVAYWKYLQETKQGPIWVFVPHCMIGTDGTNLHPLLAETVAFCAATRSFNPFIIRKGHLSNTDWFGPLEACRSDEFDSDSGLNTNALVYMDDFREIEFGGVAEDFCEFGMRDRVLRHLKGTKIRFITDGTAPIVPNAKHVNELYVGARKAGVKFITHDGILVA